MSLSIFGITSRTPSIRNVVRISIRTFFHSIRWKKISDIIVLEYGIDRPGEMDFLLSIVKPDIGIMTKLDVVHSEQFGDPQKIAQEEVKMLLKTKQIVFLNADEEYTEQIEKQLEIDSFTYATSDYNDKAAITYDNFHLTHSQQKEYCSSFHMHCNKHNLSIETNLLGKELLWYVNMSVVLYDIIAQQYQTPFLLGHKKKITLKYDLLPGRFSLYNWPHESVIIDSSYNAAPLSMKMMINNTIFFRNTLFAHYNVLLVLGDMRELWDFAEQEHRRLAWIVSQSADHVVTIWPLMQNFMADELGKIWYDTTNKLVHHSSSREAVNSIQTILNESDNKRLVLVKGSQMTIFLEETVKWLTAQIDQSWQDITLVRQSPHRTRIKDTFFATIHESKEL